MVYNIVSYITNTSDEHVVQTETTDNFTSAAVTYHNKLAALHNAADVKKATVKMVNDSGVQIEEYSETVDHTAQA